MLRNEFFFILCYFSCHAHLNVVSSFSVMLLFTIGWWEELQTEDEKESQAGRHSLTVNLSACTAGMAVSRRIRREREQRSL